MTLPINQILCGDCLDILKDFPDSCVDLVLTDPPYGIGKRLVTGGGGGGWHTMVNSGADEWDIKPSPEVFDRMFQVSHNQIIWGGNFHAMPPCDCPLCWDKVRPNQKNTSEWEYGWSSMVGRARLFRYCGNGGFVSKEFKQHPTQKPLALMEWCLSFFPEAKTVLDPYCGSGSTCVAAKKLGRNFIGIDISPEYCAIARERLEAVESGVPVREARKGQMGLFKD